MDGEPVISGGDAAEVFEFVEAAFDAIARFMDFEAVRDRALAPWIAGNDGSRADVRDEGAERIAVVGLVGEDVGRPKAVEQGRRLRNIAGLSGRENDPQRSPPSIGGKMDLGGQSTSGAPQSLILAPPFPVAAC